MTGLNGRAVKFWDKRARKFDENAKHFGVPPVGPAMRYLDKDDVVLDFGCATGTVACGIAGGVKKVVGIDISPAMVAAAVAKAGVQRINNAEFRVAAIFDGNFDGASFDRIIAFNILHFFRDTAAVLRRTNRLLNPGGLIIIAVSCMGQASLFNVLQYVLFRPLILSGAIPYMKFLTVRRLEESLCEAGFRITALENRGSKSDYFIVAEKL